jgi:hypothetical protein
LQTAVAENMGAIMRRATIAAGTSGLIVSILGLAAATAARAEPGGAAAPAVTSHTAQASPACARWTEVPVPHIGTGGVALDDVTALSVRDAWAVGNDLDNGAIQTVILHWNGSSWRRSPSPSPSSTENRLFGVAATSASNAWAVGYDLQGSKYQTLIVHWNGSSWRRVPSPNPAGTAHQNRLSEVTAVSSTSAWAVGDYRAGGGSHTLILHWNGSSWRQEASPNATRTGLLSGVAAGPGHLWAAGSSSAAHRRPLIMDRKNGSWGRTKLPGAGLLADVSGASRANAWAVGYAVAGGSDRNVIWHWNGSSWHRVPSPRRGDFDNLDGVAATSAGNAWAVGSYFGNNTGHTFLLHWNGSSWRQLQSPNPAGGADLRAVAATSAANAWAVGTSAISGNVQHALILRCH